MVAFRYTLGDLRDLLVAHEALEKLKAELAQFMEEHVQFLDVPVGDSFDVRPEAAIQFFQSKNLRPNFSYADMMGQAHDHSFSIAKLMDIDLLAQTRASLEKALSSGSSFSEWKKNIEPMLQSAGWWGKKEVLDPLTGQMVNAQLGSPWRLENIFRTNLQTSYSAGQWMEIEEQKHLAPYLLYDAIDDFRTRPAHRAWDGTVLPVDSPWWNTHYPPCGYSCRCGVLQMSADDLVQHGLKVKPEPPDDGVFKWKNPRTEVTETVPVGVDPSFAHNSGKSLLADMRVLLNEKIRDLPSEVMQIAARRALASEVVASTAGQAAVMAANAVEAAVERAASAAQIAALTAPNLLGYLEAMIAGRAPSDAQAAAYKALPRAGRAEIDRQLSLGA